MYEEDADKSERLKVDLLQALVAEGAVRTNRALNEENGKQDGPLLVSPNAVRAEKITNVLIDKFGYDQYDNIPGDGEVSGTYADELRRLTKWDVISAAHNIEHVTISAAGLEEDNTHRCYLAVIKYHW